MKCTVGHETNEVQQPEDGHIAVLSIRTYVLVPSISTPRAETSQADSHKPTPSHALSEVLAFFHESNSFFASLGRRVNGPLLFFSAVIGICPLGPGPGEPSQSFG